MSESRALTHYVRAPEWTTRGTRGIKRSRWRTPRQLLRARPIRRALSAVRAHRAQKRLIARTWKRYGEMQGGIAGLFKPRILRKAKVPKQTLRRLGFLRKAAGFSVGRALRYAAPVALAGAGYGAYRGLRGLREHMREPRAKRVARYKQALSGAGSGAVTGYLLGGAVSRRPAVRLGLVGAMAGLQAVGGWRVGGWRHDREVATALLKHIRRQKRGRS